jgi:hypothetical protein
VLRAGFEPANPCGKGFPIMGPLKAKCFDLESFTFDLAWLPQHATQATDFSVCFLINHLPQFR